MSATTATAKKSTTTTGKTAQPVRLYVKGSFIGYRRSLAKQYNHIALLAIEGVKSKKDTEFYLGKRVAYIYRAHRAVEGSKYRVIWGRVARAHGSNGVVRAKFRNNLPSSALGASVRVFLYPSRI